MTTRYPAFSSVTTAAVAALMVTLISTTAVFAQEAGSAVGSPAPATNTLDLSIPTGPAPTASAPAPKPAAKKVAPAKSPSSSRFKGARQSLPSLSSRSRTGQRGQLPQGSGTEAPASMLGKLAVVQAASATLRAERAPSGRALSIVAQGTYLAVIEERDGYLGVLMVDNTVGWISRADVEQIDYQVEITLPGQQSVGEGSDAAGLPANLDARTESLLQDAFTYLGVPYVWAGNTKRGIDCSGFVKNVFSKQGVRLPRHSGDQARVGRVVATVEELQPGDRLYFDMKHAGRIGHCGIYLGNGYFIHASSNQGKVGVDNLYKKNYWNGLVNARRDW